MADSARSGNGNGNGNGVSRSVDPTRNVLDLVTAAVDRLDDLRTAEGRVASVELRCVEERIAEESKHIREIIELRAEYEEKLREAEAKRIDAIRAVDVGAVAVASSRASDQADVLATQVSTSADTLRSLVATSASTLATQLTQLITPITDRIGLLEKAQYTGAGKEGVTDPMMAQLVSEIKALREGQSIGAGRSSGLNQGVSILLGALGAGGVILGMVSFFR